MTPTTCWACNVTLDVPVIYFDDQGRPLCSPCFWKAYAA